MTTECSAIAPVQEDLLQRLGRWLIRAFGAYGHDFARPRWRITEYILKCREPARGFVKQFMKDVTPEVRPTDRVLDAGAGNCPYKPLFAHARYESTDFAQCFDASARNVHDFVCSLDSIPRPDGTYDVVLNTEVLEHVEYPDKVVRELHRVLKPGGRLYLTTPQAWAVHGAPYNFFYFTRYGLRSLFENAGFRVRSIRPKGGVFYFLAGVIAHLPRYVLEQSIIEKTAEGKTRFRPRWGSLLILSPFYLLALPFLGLIAPIFLSFLDGLDRTKDFTIGYCCACEKPL